MHVYHATLMWCATSGDGHDLLPCRVCMDLGESGLAVCAPGYDTAEAVVRNDTSLVQKFIAAGHLVPYKPAVNYTTAPTSCPQ